MIVWHNNITTILTLAYHICFVFLCLFNKGAAMYFNFVKTHFVVIVEQKADTLFGSCNVTTLGGKDMTHPMCAPNNN